MSDERQEALLQLADERFDLRGRLQLAVALASSRDRELNREDAVEDAGGMQ